MSKPAPSDKLSPSRPPLLNLPKTYQLLVLSKLPTVSEKWGLSHLKTFLNAQRSVKVDDV